MCCKCSEKKKKKKKITAIKQLLFITHEIYKSFNGGFEVRAMFLLKIYLESSKARSCYAN